MNDSLSLVIIIYEFGVYVHVILDEALTGRRISKNVFVESSLCIQVVQITGVSRLGSSRSRPRKHYVNQWNSLS